MEISHGDRGGDPESDNPSRERATAILRQEPMQFRDCTNCDRDPQDAAHDRPREEPRLPSCVAEDGADHGAQARQSPGSEEDGDRLQGFD